MVTALPEPTREEIARREVGRTDISRGTARVLVALFLTAIAAVPIAQRGIETRGEEVAATAWSILAPVPGVVGSEWTRARAGRASLFASVVAANREGLRALDAFESAVEDEAWLAQALRSPVQYVLSGWLGVGNEQVWLGRERWLFYRPDVEYLTGPPFLAPERLEERRREGREWETPPQPDPRPAIVEFARQLDARGIALVVMPTPVKPAIHPEKLAAAYGAPIENPSYGAFIRDLEDAGILVFDPTDAIVAVRRRDDRAMYLATDTHWRPEIVELVADRLAAFLVDRAGLPPTPPVGHTAAPAEIAHAGDLTMMLDLPRGQRLYPPDRVLVRRITDPDGRPWRSSRSAGVLLLGDSFSNIYSLASMGWGDAAGFAEQLSFALHQPIDRIVQNDDGAYATRAVLRRDLLARPDRLAATRVVVWQFAARELAIGDWRAIELPAGER